ncbi:MAG TPA: hypothetical protein PK867_32095 [Pirellulales bacterium]|nr:hypothetical protein [Pirellulales bacterium]
MLNLVRWLRFGSLLIVLLAADAPPAQAHFLFIRITPPAEGGRAAEVYFSEQARAGDPRFIDKVAHTTLWRQTTPGKFEPLEVRKATDRLRAHLPASGTVAVVGECEYGVLARPVHYWDDASGRLLRSEAIDGRWTTVGGFDLPAAHTVTVSSDVGQSVRSFTLSEHHLLAGKGGEALE